MNLYTQSMLTLSTAHLRKKTADAFDAISADDNAGPFAGVMRWSTYGWVVWVADDLAGEKPEDWPDLAACFALAKTNGCQWIRFDCDVEPIAALPTYDWDLCPVCLGRDEGNTCCPPNGNDDDVEDIDEHAGHGGTCGLVACTAAHERDLARVADDDAPTFEWETHDPDVEEGVPAGWEIDYERTVALGNGRYRAPLKRAGGGDQ